MARSQTSSLPGWQQKQEKPPLTGADVVGPEREAEVGGLPPWPPAGLLEEEDGPGGLGVEGGDSWLQEPGAERVGGGGRHRGCQLRQVVPAGDFAGECELIRGRLEEKTGDACSITATGLESR